MFNLAALKAAKEIILCESLIDALTFWCAGYRNVTSAYGTNGFKPDMLKAFKDHGTQRVLIAYDRDAGGESAVPKLAEQLMAEGIECYRIEFPKGMDANEYAQKVQPAAKSLGILIRKALWLGQGRAPERSVLPAVASAPISSVPSHGRQQEQATPPRPLAAGPVAVVSHAFDHQGSQV